MEHIKRIDIIKEKVAYFKYNRVWNSECEPTSIGIMIDFNDNQIDIIFLGKQYSRYICIERLRHWRKL